jgi:hypothetical protein
VERRSLYGSGNPLCTTALTRQPISLESVSGRPSRSSRDAVSHPNTTEVRMATHRKQRVLITGAKIKQLVYLEQDVLRNSYEPYCHPNG